MSLETSRTAVPSRWTLFRCKCCRWSTCIAAQGLPLTAAPCRNMPPNCRYGRARVLL